MSSSHTPTLSIIIPALNEERYMRKAGGSIQSVNGRWLDVSQSDER